MDEKPTPLFIIRRLFIGPFQFLAFSLISSEVLLALWMFKSEIEFTERIVAGSLYLAVLIAVLVIFCIVYSIKRKHDVKDEIKLIKWELFRRLFIGPFQFLAFSLISSELLFALWINEVKSNDIFTERIVAGSFSITVLIAVLVIFCVIYSIKKECKDCEHHSIGHVHTIDTALFKEGKIDTTSSEKK